MLPRTSLHFITERCQTIITNNVVVTTAANKCNDVTVRKKVHANRSLRHAAYRNNVILKFGHLEINNRVVIPSCIVWLIRKNGLMWTLCTLVLRSHSDYIIYGLLQCMLTGRHVTICNQIIFLCIKACV